MVGQHQRQDHLADRVAAQPRRPAVRPQADVAVSGRGPGGQLRHRRQLGGGGPGREPAGGDRHPRQLILIQPARLTRGRGQPPGLRRARVHVLHRQRPRLPRRQRRAHPPVRHRVPLGGRHGVLIVRISLQEPARGQRLQQHLPIQVPLVG